MPPHHQTILDRFVAVCRADARVVAAFLGGSYARDAADAHSDLDIYVITTDAAFEAFASERAAFVRRLGEPLFVEDFGLPHHVFFIFPNDAEGELGFGRVSDFHAMHSGPVRVLLDKTGALTGATFPPHTVDGIAQTEQLRCCIYWFWHELSHFITAMARGQLWWAYGQLEAMRRFCVVLVRLRHDFAADTDADEPHFKLEKALPVSVLSPLRETFCPQERDAMLFAVRVILEFYREQAQALAQAHGIAYPTTLDALMAERLAKLGNGRQGTENRA